MEENDQADDFDDFFDTPGRSVDLEPEMTSKKSKGSSFNRSAKKRDRNNSASDSVDRSRVSNDRSASPHYSSDSFTESDSDSTSRKKKSRSRSESSSSRSGGSYSSDSGSSYSRDSRSRSSKAKGSRYSRSRSASTDRSVSRTATPDSARSPKEKPKRKRRDSYSSVTSSSSYSDTRDSERHPPSTKSKDATRRQAWGTEVTITGNKRERPKTAKWRSSDDKVLKEESNRQSRNGKGNYSDSDSDMTDVSPIASPRNSSINGHSREKKIAKPVQYQAMPLGDQEDSERNIQSAGDSSALDLDILMKAVSELEKQKRVKSNTRRVMFEPLRARPIDKSNYTFSNDDTHRIEQENKRLLRQIMRQVQTPEVRKPRASDVRVKQSVLTPSAINRRRAQQKIENENLAFLKRLQTIKPTRGLSRNEQLASYNSTVLHGIPIATLHPPKSGHRSGRQSSASSVAGSLGRTRSMTSIHSTATASSFTSASRQSSRAGSRPTSAQKSRRERPPWNDRW